MPQARDPTGARACDRGDTRRSEEESHDRLREGLGDVCQRSRVTSLLVTGWAEVDCQRLQGTGNMIGGQVDLAPGCVSTDEAQPSNSTNLNLLPSVILKLLHGASKSV